jgi:hypothetical protein
MRFEIDVSASFSRFFRAGVDLDAPNWWPDRG